MASFKIKRKGTENQTEQNNNVEAMLRRHRRRKMIRVAIVLGIIAIICLIVWIIENNRSFSDYKVKSDLEIEGNDSSSIIEFGDCVIKYSYDGASYINGKETVWNVAYEMKSPIIDVCDGYAVIGDEESNTIYLFDEDGEVGEITTSYPITKLEVAKQGVIAALMEDGTTSYIEVYDKNGDIIVTHKTILDGNGCPIDISLSEDGTKLVVSYVCINSGSMESKVLFYNYSDVGQNEVDRMVGGFNQYSSSVVPTVEFTDNDTAIAIGDNILTIYNMDEKPNIEEEIELSDEIQKVFYNEKYIGIVTLNTDSVNPYKITIYNMKGKTVAGFEISDEYDTMKFDGKTVMMYTDNQFTVVSFNGTVKFDYTFSSEIIDIVPISGSYRYLLVTPDKMQKIKLK